MANCFSCSAVRGTLAAASAWPAFSFNSSTGLRSDDCPNATPPNTRSPKNTLKNHNFISPILHIKNSDWIVCYARISGNWFWGTSQQVRRIFIGKQRGLSAGVPEEHRLVLREKSVADQVNQTGGSASGVDRIEQ